MRTTTSLDERLVAQLKRRAAEQGTSVSKLVEQAVRRALGDGVRDDFRNYLIHAT